MQVEVVKNSLASRAFRGTALEALGDALEGPCALVIGGDSAIEVAKIHVEFGLTSCNSICYIGQAAASPHRLNAGPD